jgi:hypothetical protein
MSARAALLIPVLALTLAGGQAVPTFPGAAPSALADNSSGSEVFVNEIHYAGEGVDAGEFVEIAGPSGTDLTGWQVVLYDGVTGTPYSTTPLTSTLPANGATVVDYPLEGIADGPGAVALVAADRLVEFLSWGGQVTPTSGPADDATSEDIGVQESDATPQEASLQLVGSGSGAGDFTWTGPTEGSPGATNDGQTLTTLHVTEATLPGLVTDELEPGDVVKELLPPSDSANEVLIEGESIATSTVGTPTVSQASTGALVWSGDHQLRVNAAELFDTSTMTFQLPVAGRWSFSADMTTGPNFGLAEVKVDDVVVGTFEGRVGTANALVRRYPFGDHDLAAGDHTITLTAIGARNGQVRIGLDLMRWRLQPAAGALTLSPDSKDAVRGQVPVYGWSTSVADRLTVQVDHDDVSDWEALGDTATLVYRARDLQSGSPNFFQNGIVVRGHKLILDHDVTSGTNTFAADGIQVSGELLHPGENTITVFAGRHLGSADPNLDDFGLQNVWLQLADGTVLKDPGKADNVNYPMGDSPGAAAERTWTFTIPPPAEPRPTYRPAAGYLLDTQGLGDGDHVVTLVAEGPAGTVKLHHRITVDNGAPVVGSLTPAQGTAVKGTFVLNASVTDAGDRRPVVDARLDGSPVQLGDSVSTDVLADGQHTFTVVVTDAAGNHDQASTTFTTRGETPDAPQLVGPADGGTVSGPQVPLAVTATDPAGEKLHVDLLQATQAGPPVAGWAGASTGDLPAPAAGADNPVDLAPVVMSDDSYVDSPPSGDTPYQRYDVRISKVRGAKYVDLSWEGRVAADRDAVLSVWDVGLQQWKEVTSARGSDTADTTVVGTTRLGPAIDGEVVHVLVEARDPFADVPSKPDHAFRDPGSYDFAIAWMSDTQYLAQGGALGTPKFGETYQAINDWIMSNASQRKIVYTAHTGDIINSWQSTSTDLARARKEFVFASKMMDILEGKPAGATPAYMPNGVLPGNHDNRTGSNNDLYNEYFGPARYEALEALAPTGEDGQGFYGGPWRPGDNQNHYDLIEAGGTKLIFVHLGYTVRDDEIAWANQVLADHRDRAAVILTHSYLLPSNAPDGRGGDLTTMDGRDLYAKVVVPNPNVFLTLSGHTHGVGLNIKHDVGVKGRTVVEMLANHQFFEVNGERRVGHFRLLQVNLQKGQVTVDTYSPYLDNWDAVEFDTQPGRKYLEEADEFVVPVDLPSRTTSLRTDAIGMAVRGTTVIGSADIASGGQASVNWTGRAAGTRYSWYARATDPTGASAESTVFTFVTAGTTR